MRATIGKAFKFEAAHVIPWHKNRDGTPGKCSKLHGHSYSGMAYVRGLVDELGWVLDFHEMAEDLQAIEREYDHTCLNEVPPFKLRDDSEPYWPTTEHVAASILATLRAMNEGYCRVLLRETATSEVIVEVGDLE